MTIVSLQQLTADMRSRARDLEGRAGLVPQATDRPLEADDLLFYICHTTTPMAQLLREHRLFVDEAGLHFDVGQFETIRKVAQQVVTERRKGTSTASGAGSTSVATRPLPATGPPS